MSSAVREHPPTSRDQAGPTRRRWVGLTGRPLLGLALGLVVLQLLGRAWLLSGRYYYADDFRLLDVARRPLFSGELLFTDLDGHVMPGAFFVAGLVGRIAPLDWWPAALSLLLMQALASLAVLRLLRQLVGDRAVLLIPLAFYLVSPLTLGSSAWWAAALNSMPLQIGMAWVLGEAVLLARTGRRRHAVAGALGLALTLAFYERGVLVLPTAFAVVVVVVLLDGSSTPLSSAWRRGRLLWLGSALVLGVWAAGYAATTSGGGFGSGTAESIGVFVSTGLKTLATGLFGGPWQWSASAGTIPFSRAPHQLVVLSVLAVIGACWYSCVRLRHAALVWALAAGHSTLGLVLAGIGRAGLGMDGLVPLAYRYFAADAVVLTAAGGLLLMLPVITRAAPAAAAAGDAPPSGGPSARQVATAVGLVVVVASLASTVTYARAWRADRTAEYVAAARAALADAGPAPLLDQSVPAFVEWPQAYPYNLISVVLGPLADRPPIADHTDDLRMLDDTGHLRAAQVTGVDVDPTGSPGCGVAVAGPGPTAVPLTVAVFLFEWTVRLDYDADRAGEVRIGLGTGAAVTAPVQAGAHSVFVRLTGGGDHLQVTPVADVQLCVPSGVLGTVVLR